MKTNKYIYILSSLIIYIATYLLLSISLKNLYNPVLGIIIIIIVILIDNIIGKSVTRIYIRIFFALLIYFILYTAISILSDLTTSPSSYNIFDKIPFIILKNSYLSLIFIIFYFIFDSLIKNSYSSVRYYISTILIVTAITTILIILNIEEDISKTIFKNYFFYGIFLIILTILLIIRHISFFSMKNNRNLTKKDLLTIAIIILAIIFFLIYITLNAHIKNNSKGSKGGLLSEGLFQFDFSNFLELKDEIKLSEDRVLILELNNYDREDQKNVIDRQIYLKRFSLEEYKNGKFVVNENYQDKFSPPPYLSNYIWQLEDIPQYSFRKDIEQIIYLINIDSTALLGSDLITKVVPMVTWDDSSFKQVYRTYSKISTADTFHLLNEDLSQKKFLNELDKKRKSILMNYGTKTNNETKNDDRIKDLAIKVAGEYSNPLIASLVITYYLQNNYYYSLKPGHAPDGNQLKYFLFDSKKGYCSYFAFAMCYMLRSLGIVSRVAIGFAPDLNNSTLNFYEVRSMDGHAWVEVFIDGYGWLTFDPTSQNISPDEEYQFALGNKEERDKYIEEILKNKNKLKDVENMRNDITITEQLFYKLKRSIRFFGILLLLVVVLIFVIVISIKKGFYSVKFKISKDKRKKTMYLYLYTLGKLNDIGYSILEIESPLEYKDRLSNIINLEKLTFYYQKAIFNERDDFDIDISEIYSIKGDIDNFFKTISIKQKLYSFFNISRLWRKVI